jgi:hypothetical protein
MDKEKCCCGMMSDNSEPCGYCLDKLVKGDSMDTQKDKATPRPWHVDNEFYIRDEKHNAIGQLYGSIGGFQVLGNASLVIKGVNNYETLLEACQTALASLSRGDCQDIAVKMLRQAIAQATK